MGLPLDLEIKILSKLPPKSLMRFKCVSKLWFSLIRSRHLTNLHLTVASPPRLYVSLLEQCHSIPKKSLLVSLSSSISDNVESFEQDSTVPGLGGYNMMVLRGLIIYEVCQKACIYNPATRQSLTLPAINFTQEEGFEEYLNYFLGHDPVLDQYKVVCTVTLVSSHYELRNLEHWVFVLEVGGAWKRIEFDQEPHLPTGPRLYLDGVVYYLAGTGIYNDVLVSFDVKSEELSMIQPPDDVAKVVASVGFVEYGGKPALLDHSDLVEYGLLVLWVLEDGGEWSKKSMVLQPCHMHLVDSIIGAVVVGTTRNGEVILEPLSEPFGFILCYDLQKNNLRKVEIRGIPNHRFVDPYASFTLFDKNESIMHLEI